MRARVPDLITSSLRAGFWASLAMMPFGFAFRAAGLRVGHYGPQLLEALFGPLQPPLLPLALLVQHFVIGGLSAFVLLAYWQFREPLAVHRIRDGLLYGALYYVLVNAWWLPLTFGDPTPWELGPAVVLPSLVVHLVFGLCIGLVERRRTRARRAT